MSTYEYQGGCHCKDIRYKLNLTQTIETCEIINCNCSICKKTGFLHLIVPKSQFKLHNNADKLANYQFNKKIAKHYFCKTCGIKSFYQPRSHPDSWSINVRCLDNYVELDLNITNFDGKNWQQNIEMIT